MNRIRERDALRQKDSCSTASPFVEHESSCLQSPLVPSAVFFFFGSVADACIPPHTHSLLLSSSFPAPFLLDLLSHVLVSAFVVCC